MSMLKLNKLFIWCRIIQKKIIINNNIRPALWKTNCERFRGADDFFCMVVFCICNCNATNYVGNTWKKIYNNYNHRHDNYLYNSLQQIVVKLRVKYSFGLILSVISMEILLNLRVRWVIFPRLGYDINFTGQWRWKSFYS